jgi:uncharacterized protein (TIGR02246 family)
MGKSSAQKGGKMKTLLILIPLVFLLCFIVGCQQGERVLVEPIPDVEADIQAIKDLHTNALAAFNAADLDKHIQFYAEDAVLIIPNEPEAIGNEAIRSRIQEMFNQFIIQEENVFEDVKVSSDLAVAHLTWSSIVTPKTGGEPSEYYGNWILVFDKQFDAAWKVIYSIWSDETLISPVQAE